MIGTFGDLATFSIRSEKMIGVGEGGVVTTNNSGLLRLSLGCQSGTIQNKQSHIGQNIFMGEGYNYRLPHMGAIARAQIERFEDEILPEKIRVGEAFRFIFGENDIWSIQSIAKILMYFG